MTHDLVVFIRLNGMDATAIRISPYTTIRELEAYLPDSTTATFFLEGMELSPAFTLSFCGVTDNSVVDIVTKEKDLPPKVPTERPPQPKLQDRLADQFYNHVEGTTTSYRKMVGRFLAFGARPSKRRPPPAKKTVIPAAADQPATDELPQFW
jgi:hypothetical protein